MKKFLLPLLGCAVWLGGCSKGDDGLKRVANVTIKMDDPKFIEYCLNYFDTDNNGKLSMQEAEQVTRIDFTDMGLNLTSLAGIEYFSNLEWLDCENNSLTELDLSYNTTLNQLYCSKNQLTSLILPQKTPWGAKGNILSTIHCSQNRLTELDASNSFQSMSPTPGCCKSSIATTTSSPGNSTCVIVMKSPCWIAPTTRT